MGTCGCLIAGIVVIAVFLCFGPLGVLALVGVAAVIYIAKALRH
jgi:hypothetical protein